MKIRRIATNAAARLLAMPKRGGASRRLQTGAVPWREASAGTIEILLVTSRDSPRWLPPKGWPMRGKSLAAAAAQEAWEEAGVEGKIADEAIGEVEHLKQHASLGPIEVTIQLYPLQVERELDDWPERKERARRWFTPDEAATIVESAPLADLIRHFAASRSQR